MLRERLEEGAQKPRQPAQEEAEVVAGGGEHGIDPIAVAPLQIIAAHAVLGLGMADDWFDGGSPPHLAANGFGDAPNLAADPDAELLFVIRRVSMPVGCSSSVMIGPSVWRRTG